MRHLLLLLLTVLLPSGATAGITSVGGAVVEIPAPADTSLGQLQSNTEIHVFVEAEGVMLFQAIAADASAPGLYASTAGLAPSTVDPGKRVDSHLLHIDPQFGSRTLLGSVTFDRPILGVIALDDTLVASDPSLAIPSTTYPIPLERGLELDLNTDEFTISADSMTLDVEFTASTALDQIRVVTASAAPVPSLSPTGLALVATSILVTTLFVNRRRQHPKDPAAE